MPYIKLPCPNCHNEQLKKNGKTAHKTQRYLCKSCGKPFITDYSYKACHPSLKSRIVPMTLNSSGIRDISRVLKISTKTVLSTLKKADVQLRQREKPQKVISVEVDEQWSYVGNKSFQRWLWDAWDRPRKKSLNYVIGDRTDARGECLLKKIQPSQIQRYYTDEWPFYRKALPIEKHGIGKCDTQNLERQNLNHRTHLKR